MLNDESCVRFFCMTRAARALEIGCDSRKQKLYRLNQQPSAVVFSRREHRRMRIAKVEKDMERVWKKAILLPFLILLAICVLPDHALYNLYALNNLI